MREPVHITDLRFTEAPEAATRGGLLGWVQFTLNDLVVLEGVALRRTLGGDRLVLSFPARRDGSGHQRFFSRPVSDPVRREIERQVFEHLQVKQDLAP